MFIRFIDERNIEIDDCRIMWRNFSGLEGRFPDPIRGRGFAVIIPNQELADALTENGWDVIVRPARDEDEDPLYLLKVKFNYLHEGLKPTAYLKSGRNMKALDEDTIGILDRASIMSVNADIRRSEYIDKHTGELKKTNYLKHIKVTQQIDRFAAEMEAMAAEEEGIPFAE